MSDLDRRSRSLATPAFFALCALGIAVAIGLTLTEATSEPDYEIGDVEEERRGADSAVTAVVTNETGEVRCPEVRIAARDRSARDLAEAVAEPVSSDGRIRPGRSATYRATLRGLSEQERREELEELRAYVFEDRPCP